MKGVYIYMYQPFFNKLDSEVCHAFLRCRDGLQEVKGIVVVNKREL